MTVRVGEDIHSQRHEVSGGRAAPGSRLFCAAALGRGNFGVRTQICVTGILVKCP
jgi:hypothetical protein